jgi:hypothetical protein
MVMTHNSHPIPLQASDKNKLKYKAQFIKIRKKLLGAIGNYMNNTMQMYGGVSTASSILNLSTS